MSTENKEYISLENVKDAYKERAAYHGDANAVLDGSSSPKVRHTNIMIDYLTRRALMEYLKPVKSDTILDYGCGVGRLTFVVAQHAKKVYGVDVTPELLAIAKKDLVKKGDSNIEFLSLNTDTFEIPDARFDKIFLVGTLVHISDEMLAKILPQFYSKLKTGGKVILLEHLRIEETQYFNNNSIMRSVGHVKNIFAENKFRCETIKHAIRMPSYAIQLWKKVNSSFTFLLPLLYQVEKMTVDRKPEFISYHYHICVFTKG